jgi:hypothetical protein
MNVIYLLWLRWLFAEQLKRDNYDFVGMYMIHEHSQTLTCIMVKIQ